MERLLCEKRSLMGKIVFLSFIIFLCEFTRVRVICIRVTSTAPEIMVPKCSVLHILIVRESPCPHSNSEDRQMEKGRIVIPILRAGNCDPERLSNWAEVTRAVSGVEPRPAKPQPVL